jgi:predicted  nucleic acid-binding Zn-ribbon protein
MSPDVQSLIDLQLADKEIKRLQDEIAALPKRVAAIEEKLAGTKTKLAKTKEAIKGDEAARRKYDTAIADLQQKISKYRDQSLSVKTNDQYRALLQEIQFAEQEIRGNEDKILELMVNAEAREKDVKAAEAELKAETAEIEKEKVAARERTAEDEKQLTDWNAKRDKARGGVNPDLLRHYDRVAKHRGTGLSEVRGQKCSACQVILRPQVFNEVRSGENTIVCESCQRILYYNPASENTDDQATVQQKRRRAHPKHEASQAWYYRPEYDDQGEVFLVFINSHGSSTRRVYDVASGRMIGDILSREGEYRLAFPEDLNDSVRLNGHWAESELEEWASELPTFVLDALNSDLHAARVEGAVNTHPHHAGASVQHPAAS